jgi:hypothetical protein
MGQSKMMRGDGEPSFMCLHLQRLAANEIRPPADLRWDAFFAGKFLTHAAGEKLGSLFFHGSVLVIKIKGIWVGKSIDVLSAP